MHSDLGTAVGGDALKGGVVHLGAVISLVGDGPQNHEGNAIAVGGLGFLGDLESVAILKDVILIWKRHTVLIY